MSDRARVEAIEQNLIQYLDQFGRIPGGVLHQRAAFRAIEAGPLRRVYAARLPEHAQVGIQEALSLFSSAPFPITWMVSPSSTPDDLGARLLEMGFTHAVDWAGMSLSLHAPEIKTMKPQAFGCERVKDKETLSGWVEIAISGFKQPPLASPELLDVFTRLGLGRSAPFELYLGTWRERPVATGMLYRQKDVAGVYWIATAPQARGQGMATALTGEMLRQAQCAGASMVVLHATPMARTLYERMGFDAGCTIGLYSWGATTPVRKALPHSLQGGGW